MKKFETYGILTSKGIQERYISAIYKRAKVEMINEYLLIDVSSKANITCSSISDTGNEDTSEVSDDRSTQSKVKESKVNQSKTHTNSCECASRPTLESFDEFWKRYPNKIMQQQAASLWLSIDPDESLVEEIMQGLDRWLASDQWERGIYQSPINWLRDERWKDHPPKRKQKKEQAGSHHYQDEEIQDLIAQKMAKQRAARI